MFRSSRQQSRPTEWFAQSSTRKEVSLFSIRAIDMIEIHQLVRLARYFFDLFYVIQIHCNNVQMKKVKHVNTEDFF